MSANDVEFKDPEALTQEMGEAIFTEMFGEDHGFKGEPKLQSEAQPVEQNENIQPSDDKEVPNAQIRLDKMRQQRDEERSQRAELEKRLAQMEGKLSVLDKKDDSDNADPFDYMDETQQFLYKQNQELKDTVEKLANSVQGMKEEGSRAKLTEQENQFFENNPELKDNRDKFVNDMLDYLDDKPGIKKMLRDGELKLSEVYGMYTANNPKSVKQSQVSDPDKVFSGSSNAVSAGKTSELDQDVAYKKALQILHTKDSTNKKQATDFIGDKITQDIISQLEI